MWNKFRYIFICYEKIEGPGPLSWTGEHNYFLRGNDAKEFIQQRFASLGQKTDDNNMRDDNGALTEQYLVTYNIFCEPCPEPDKTDESDEYRKHILEMEDPFWFA